MPVTILIVDDDQEFRWPMKPGDTYTLMVSGKGVTIERRIAQG